MRIILILLLIISQSSFAGLHNFTMHSRANCGNNESISWHWRHYYWLWTSSVHIDKQSGTVLHSVVADWDKTWRSAAVHWGEGIGGWAVWGHHWTVDNRNQAVKIGEEYVTDCSIYDGWWDK